jgi:lysophospholipase L1-like esterase
VATTERWPVQLAQRLRGEGFNVAEPKIIARTGWTARELSAAIDNAGPGGPYHLVTLLIGVNNQFRGLGIESYRTELARLLRRAVELAAGEPSRVIVLSIPDWGVTPFAEGADRRRIAREIDLFNAVTREETLRIDARYIDITPISRLAQADASLLADDGLHPSGKMYEEWTDLLMPAARAIFAAP